MSFYRIFSLSDMDTQLLTYTNVRVWLRGLYVNIPHNLYLDSHVLITVLLLIRPWIIPD